MMKFPVALIPVLMGTALVSRAQMPDTTGIYGERRDSLDATVLQSSGGSTLSRFKDVRTEVINASGLCKMACCNLAESFENSASVTVGYSDAVTGARQIRLLGQSGIYTQMLDENRPVMRGLSAPFGLGYVPGQWLESIQISKGVSSVINGVESMTGQINMEHRKPTDEKPFYLQGSFMSDLKADLNLASSLQMGDRWSTVLLAHADGNFKSMDHNGDGFMDDPRSRQFSFSNRWLYFDPSGLQVRFGIRAIQDNRLGGQMESVPEERRWKADLRNRNLGGYLKVGVPLNEDNSRNFAVVADYTYQDMRGAFGLRRYDAGQHSGFVNLLYQDQSSEAHHFTVGLSDVFDGYDENFVSPYADGFDSKPVLNSLGAFGEYTYHYGETFSLIAGLRADWFAGAGVKASPRLTVRWTPHESVVLRANGGRGIRRSTPLVDNFGVLSTSKALLGDFGGHILEDAWTFGANVTWYLPFDDREKTYVSLDYFRTDFAEKNVLCYGQESIALVPLSVMEKGRSFTNNYQFDFAAEPLERFTINLTARYTDARETLPGIGLAQKPMTSSFKGVLNLQYATRLNKWIFDATLSVNGPCRVWDFMKDMYPSGSTQWYPLLYAQVTKRFKNFDIYVGGENLTDFRQKNPVIGASDPWDSKFDASLVWGPLMGIKIYAGVRLTIWKTV